MAARADELSSLVATQPGVAEVMPREQVAAAFANAARESQPAWSLLYYALWHSHHVLGVSADGDIAEVLSASH